MTTIDITGIDALFVDEFQDVDDIQLELFERVQAKKKVLYWRSPTKHLYISWGYRRCDEEIAWFQNV